MSSRDISSLDIAPSVAKLLIDQGFRNTDDLNSLTPVELAKELSISLSESAQILKSIKNEGANKSIDTAVSALDLCRKANSMRPIISFCKSLDKILGGGVQIGQITEFSGVPGIGKTQLGIQLALDAQIPEIFTGNGGESIYIDTEGSFMVERVAEMAQALSNHLAKIASKAAKSSASEADSGNYHTTAASMTVNRLLQGIHVFRAHNQVEQIAIFNSLDAFLKTHTKIKLIVVDSIAFHFRQDLQEVSTRSRVLSNIAQTLNKLAYDHDLAVVSINHITTRVSASSASGGASRIVPALGEQWSHCIANRVMMFWQGNQIRTACLIKSASRPQGLAQFTINQYGVRDVQNVSHVAPVSGGNIKQDTRGSTDDAVSKRQRI